MATQLLGGVTGASINGIFVQTSEEITWKPPQKLFAYVESNAGPLSSVKTWKIEQGNIGLTLVHYAGFDYSSLFSDYDEFNVTVSFSSGAILTVKSSILAEAPSNSIITPTTEVSFNFLESDMSMPS